MRRDTCILHGLQSGVDYVHMRPDHLFHVVVAVFHGQFDAAITVFLIQKGGNLLKSRLAPLEFCPVVVTDDVFQHGAFLIAAHFTQMGKAFVALGTVGPLMDRQQGIEFHGDKLGVDHTVFRITRVDVPPMESDNGGGGIEVFVLQLAQGAAVDGVGVIGAEVFEVETVRAPADLLIRRKADADSGVGDVRSHQFLDGGQDLCDTGLVVGTQKGRSVGDDQVLADVVGQTGKIGRGEDVVVIETDVAARILDNARTDVGTGAVGRGVHMGDQADDGSAGRARNGAVDIAVGIHIGVGNAHGFHFLHQCSTQELLLGGGGAGLGAFVGPGVKRNIFEETFGNCHNQITSKDSNSYWCFSPCVTVTGKCPDRPKTGTADWQSGYRKTP